MEIVIDIPEGIYKNMQRRCNEIQAEGYTLENAVLNGTVLPKGHGALKDVDALYKDLMFPNEQFSKAFKDILDDAPTIIEADK